MDHRRILERIRAIVRRGSYLVPLSSTPEEQRAVLAPLVDALMDERADPERIRRRIQQLRAEGRIDRVMQLSALGVLAASPAVRDYAEAARLAGQQELAALDLGGPHLEAYLASADRHRGVLAYLLGHVAVALDWFGRALEREPTAENLGNVLAALLRLGEPEEARRLAAQAAWALPEGEAQALSDRIARDDDLLRLR